LLVSAKVSFPLANHSGNFLCGEVLDEIYRKQKEKEIFSLVKMCISCSKKVKQVPERTQHQHTHTRAHTHTHTQPNKASKMLSIEFISESKS
jgi:hypothetical protein